jgi:hypothetical protein
VSNDELLTSAGNPEFAGKTCQRAVTRSGSVCGSFARYEVINPNTREAYIACGAHLAEYVRLTWVRAQAAAVVKEIPGMWRNYV